MRRSLPAAAGCAAFLLLPAACAKYDANGNNAAAPASALAPGDLTPIVDGGGEAAMPPPVAAAPRKAERSLGTGNTPVRPAMEKEESTYRALGTEPFWAITILRGTATLTRPGRSPLTLPVVRTDDRRAIRYGGEGLTIALTPGPCSDGMSDALYADHVQIAFAEGTLKGCGGPRIDAGEAPRD